ncbi:hypothetical protein [Ornithinimicrobium kibberense]
MASRHALRPPAGDLRSARRRRRVPGNLPWVVQPQAPTHGGPQ